MNDQHPLKVIFEKPNADNHYERALVIAKRARQIIEHRLEAFRGELDNMGISEFNNDQIINTDGWQEILAKTYEDKKSPIACAAKELDKEKLVWSYTKEE